MTIGASSSASPIILDTNVISEIMRAAPETQVEEWVRGVPPALVHTTAVTLAEVRFGIARLPAGRRQALLEAADDVFEAFADRVLPFDAAAADHYADLVVQRQRVGAPITGFDAQIAAICRARGASLATRNTRDFVDLGIDVVDPWMSGI